MATEDLVKALTVPFAAGFIVQRFLEILDPVTVRLIKDPNTKKIVLGFVSLGIGCLVAGCAQIKMFHELLNLSADSTLPNSLDYFFTGIFISAGTEGFNSLLKFANYKKEASKADAASKMANAGGAVKNVNPQT